MYTCVRVQLAKHLGERDKMVIICLQHLVTSSLLEEEESRVVEMVMEGSVRLALVSSSALVMFPYFAICVSLLQIFFEIAASAPKIIT